MGAYLVHYQPLGLLAIEAWKAVWNHTKHEKTRRKEKETEAGSFSVKRKRRSCVFLPPRLCEWLSSASRVIANFGLLFVVTAQRKVWPSNAKIGNGVGDGGHTLTMVILIHRKGVRITQKYPVDTHTQDPTSNFLSANLAVDFLPVNFILCEEWIQRLKSWMAEQGPDVVFKEHQRKKGKVTQA